MIPKLALKDLGNSLTLLFNNTILDTVQRVGLLTYQSKRTPTMKDITNLESGL